KEIHEYYQRREEILLERNRHQPPPKPETPPAEDKIDVFGDADGSIRRVVDRRVKEEIERVANTATPALVNSCRIGMRDRYPDYARFSKEVEKRMSTMTPDAQMNPDYWEYTYKIVKGEQVETIVQEAREDERKKQNPVERPTPPGTPPPAPRQLTDEEKK